MTPAAIVRRSPLLSFFLLACLVGWSPYVITYLTGGSEKLPLGPVVAVALFFVRFLSGADHDQLGYLLGGGYVVVATAACVAGRRYLTLRDDTRSTLGG